MGIHFRYLTIDFSILILLQFQIFDLPFIHSLIREIYIPPLQGCLLGSIPDPTLAEEHSFKIRMKCGSTGSRDQAECHGKPILNCRASDGESMALPRISPWSGNQKLSLLEWAQRIRCWTFRVEQIHRGLTHKAAPHRGRDPTSNLLLDMEPVGR